MYRATPFQQGMLFNRVLAKNTGVDIEQIVFDMREDLDVPAFKSAWKRIMERHEVFRSSFHWEELEEPIVKVQAQVPLPFAYHDWRKLPPTEQEAQLDCLMQTERCLGFDLAAAPLMRLTLCQLESRRFQMIWTFEHLLLDGRSFTLVIKEVFRIYESLRNGHEQELTAVRPYRDYVEWLEDQNFSKAETYWRSLLKGFTAPTPIVADQPRLIAGSAGYGEHFGQLSVRQTQELKDLATAKGITLNTLVQGAWALLLSRHSGEEDIVFGATRAGRKSTIAGAESMVGLFINTTPVRLRVRPEMSLIQWLQEVREQQFQIRNYERTPLRMIQEWSQVPKGTLLFDSLVVFERSSLNAVLRAEGGAWLNRHFRVIDQTNYPVTLFAYGEPALLLKLSHDEGRMGKDEAARISSHLETLLSGMPANLEKKLGDIYMLPAAEREQVLVEWNHTEKPYPAASCLHEVIAAQSRKTPKATALVCGDRELSYQQVYAYANRVADRLQKLGVGPEVLVGVCMDVSVETVAVLLGVLKAGGAYVPLDPDYPKERLVFMLQDSQAAVLLTQSKYADAFADAKTTLVCLDEGSGHWSLEREEPLINPPSKAVSDNLAYVLYTSGSTGQPKGVMVTHRNILNFFAGMDERLGTEPGVWLAVTTISFDISVLELFWTLARGFKVVLQRRGVNLVGEMAQQIRRHGVTHLQCTPSMAEMFVREPEAREALCSLQQLLLGGEALSPELVRNLDIPGKLLNMYGPTETTVWSTTCEVDKKAKQISIGRPIANTEVYILDKNLQPTGIGVPGELFIGGAGVARGYWRRDELTQEKFVPHPFRHQPGARLYKTGDRARFLGDGTIQYIGRLDQQVKVRGFRIELGEIEATLRQHADISEVVADLKGTTASNIRLTAYIVPVKKPGPDLAGMREWLRRRLPEHMVPSNFVLLDKLPHTPNGKIDRQALLALEVESRASEGSIPPRSDIEARLAEIWCRVLDLQQIGIHDNFFECGGHSLLAMKATAEVRANLDKKASLVQLYQHPTIYGLAQDLSPQRGTRQVSRKLPILPRTRRQFRWPRKSIQAPASVQSPTDSRYIGVFNRNGSSANLSPGPTQAAALGQAEPPLHGSSQQL